MEKNIIDDLKLIEIWLTNDEQQHDLENEINKLCSYGKAMGYKTVVFRSGNKDLFDCTEGLILNNYQL